MGPDVNTMVAGALRDLAAVQTSMHSRWGYKRAAASVARLDYVLASRAAEAGCLFSLDSAELRGWHTPWNGCHAGDG